MTGRDDIELIIMNTALSKGLKQVIGDLIEGECVDAVVSSVPGSNYAYGQISTLLPGRPNIDSENILCYRDDLRNLLGDIAFGICHPSNGWRKSTLIWPNCGTRPENLYIYRSFGPIQGAGNIALWQS
jgi:hypothetical protein